MSSVEDQVKKWMKENVPNALEPEKGSDGTNIKIDNGSKSVPHTWEWVDDWILWLDARQDKFEARIAALESNTSNIKIGNGCNEY